MKVISIILVVMALAVANMAYARSKLVVQISSLKFLERYEAKEYLGDDVDLPMIKANRMSKFILVNVKTNIDFVDIRNDGFTLWMDGYFCDSPNDLSKVGLVSIYRKGENISFKVFKHKSRKISLENSKKYNFIIFTSWKIKQIVQAKDKKREGQE